MPLSKRTRWSLIAVCGVLAVLFGPLALIMAGNLGGGILNLVLNRRPALGELTGTYKLKVPWGTAHLDIYADGAFREEIDEKGKPARVVTGRWQSREDSNFLKVDFRPFGMVWDDDHDRDTNIYGINFYKPHFGVTFGVIDDDLGESFKRQ